MTGSFLADFLESQVGQNYRPLCSRVARNSLKVAQNYGPVAFYIDVSSRKGAFTKNGSCFSPAAAGVCMVHIAGI